MRINAPSQIDSLVAFQPGRLEPVSPRSAVEIAPDAVSQSPTVPAQQNLEATEAALEEALQRLNEEAQKVNHNINFSVDPDSKRVVVRLIDAARDEVVYQFPSEEALRLASSLEELSGMLVNQKV
jgi:flagellar protein FlaG